jgi:hypothetical protein
MVLPDREMVTGGSVEVRYFGHSFSAFAIRQEIMSSLPQIGGHRCKAAHRGNGTQKGTACNRPTGPEDQAQATASRPTAKDAPQASTGPATATHHTRLTPNPSLADIPLS